MKKNILLTIASVLTVSVVFANTIAAVVTPPTIVIPVDTMKSKTKMMAAQKTIEFSSNKLQSETWQVSKMDIASELTKGIEFSNPFPNPANQQTGINFQLPSPNSEARIMLRNLLGSVVKEIKVTGAENKFSINTSDLNSGLYFYSVLFENKILFTKKLIVKH